MTATTFTNLRADSLLGEEAQRGPRTQREQREAAGGPAGDLTFSPMIDQVAYGFARVLVAAMKELEAHIANENRKLGDTVGERLGALQASVNELADNVSAQRAETRALQEKCQTLEAATASLKECDMRREEELVTVRNDVTAKTASVAKIVESAVATLQEADASQIAELASVRGLINSEAAALRECDARQGSAIARLQTETHAMANAFSERISGLVDELAVQQEDVEAIKATLKDFSSRLDLTLSRVEKQSEALHTMYTTYAQRESELERLIEGLTRLKAVSAPLQVPRL
jgi:chromosome segregation ATPase